MRSARCWGGFLLVLFSCGTPKQGIPIRQSLRTAEVNPASRKEENSPSQKVRQIARQIAELRGWDPNLVPLVEIASSSRIVAAMLADERSQVTPPVQLAESEFLQSFGWVPRNFDFERDVTEYYSHNLLGLYSFTWKRVLLAGSNDTVGIEFTLRHELVHAFQDKRYGIGDRVRWHKDQGDRIAAVHALAEGEAICLSRQLEDPQQRGCLDFDSASYEERILAQDLVPLPAIIKYSLVSPYIDGLRYVQQLLRHGGWPEVELAWQVKLTDTHVLLHPNELATVRPVVIDIPSAPQSFANCQAQYVDVLGEQGLGSILRQNMGRLAAYNAASKVTGDRVAFWRCGNVCAAAWHLRMKSADSAPAIAEAIWTSMSSEMRDQPASKLCRECQFGVVGLEVLHRDIAITSLHACNGLISQVPALSCAESNVWTSRIVSQPIPH